MRINDSKRKSNGHRNRTDRKKVCDRQMEKERVSVTDADKQRQIKKE